MHIREAVVAALETEGELLVVEAEAMEDCRVQIVDVNLVLCYVEAKLVRFTDSHARFDTAACQPHRERLRVVVASQLAAEVRVRLNHWRAPEFPAPDDKRVFQQAALFEILDKRGAALVGFLRLVLYAVGHFAMMIPAFMEKLHKTHAPFDEPARKETVHGETGLADFHAVHLERLR